jgi:triphosphatase
MKELEAKFLLQQGTRRNKALRRALQELSWAGFLAHPQGLMQIADTYYDTAGATLQNAGWTLRRRSEQGQCQLTLKQLATPQAGMFNRRELQQTLSWSSSPHITADWNRLERGSAVDFLHSLLSREAVLEPLFQIDTQRQRYQLTSVEHPRSHIELALDRSNISAPSAASDFVELEAELKQGPESLVQEIALILDQQPQLIRARVSKYQRGLQTIGHPPVDRLRDESPSLTPSSAWADLGIKHLNTQVRTLRQHEPLAWEGAHSEGVHQMRVAIRRIRAALGTFDSVLSREGGESLSAEVRWLGQRLGSVRDLDVHLTHTDNYSHVLHPDDQSLLRYYRRHLLKARNSAHSKLRGALASDRFTSMQRDLQQFVERSETQKLGFEFRSIEEMARQHVIPQLRKVLRRGRTIDRKSPAKRLHKLRIEIKRLRYQLEFLHEPYGRDLKKSTRRLSRLQNTLGDHQDACVARGQLRHYRIHHELGKRESGLFKRLSALEDDHARRCRKQFFKDWQKFELEARKLRQMFI